MTDTEIERPVDAPQPAGWGRYGKRPALLLASVSLIDSIDRGILPGVLTDVQDDLGFSDTQMGALAAAFVVAGFLVVLPAGYLADRFRRTRIIATVLATWGVMSAMNAAVNSYWQFLTVRSALGVGETVDNPSSSSLLSDYYPPEARGRAFAVQRVAPIVGSSIGLGLGGLVAALLGWRWAFLIVGVPGSLLAIAIWRLPEPVRGESDGPGGSGDVDAVPAPVLPVTAAPVSEETAEVNVELVTEPSPFRAMRRDLGKIARIPTLRALFAGTMIASGALNGMGFWATAFYERHTSLGKGGSAGIVAALIALGALAGTFVAGRLVDRMRDRVLGFPMLLAGVTELVGSVFLFATFLPVPLWFRLPGQTIAVICIVGGLLPLAVMVSEVVPAHLRGAAFSLSFFLASVGGALSPFAIGAIADRFERVPDNAPMAVEWDGTWFDIDPDGEPKGDIAKAFLCVTPLVTAGALVVLRGRRHVETDLARAAADRAIASQ
ncbi:MAG TPA: MFS transporter [Acidimicrobiales bacterium]|nr:MFS transporter [Acidimicrobiales bacterium]